MAGMDPGLRRDDKPGDISNFRIETRPQHRRDIYRGRGDATGTNHFIHLDHDQTYSASAGVAYTIPWTRTKLAASVIFGSGLRAGTDTVPNGASLPDYEQVNLSVAQKVDTGIFQGLEMRSTSSICSI